jgi:hypothetical protein
MTAVWWALLVGLVLGVPFTLCGQLALRSLADRAERKRRSRPFFVDDYWAAKRLREDLRAKRGRW